MADRDFRVAAAIDFGTHGTGFAWASVNSRNDNPVLRDIHYRVQWPDLPVPAVKALSAVLLDPAGEVQHWGYAARRQRDNPSRGPGSYFYGFKLGLFADAEPPPAHLPGPEAAVEIAGSYLREIVRLAIRDITSAGHREEDIRWCVTAPAIWDARAMTLTRQAAVRAGLPDSQRLHLVREPEAAAIFCLIRGVEAVDADRVGTAVPLPRGSRYLIVDCGGGTIDTSAWQVDRNSQLRPCGELAGGPYGSEYLNLAFVNDILARRLGGAEIVAELVMSHRDALVELTDEWERQKLAVAAHVASDGSVLIDAPVFVTLSRTVDRALHTVVPEAGMLLRRLQGGSDGHIIVQPPELTELFDSVVEPILSIVDRQLDALSGQRMSPNQIPQVLLVGGFAQSSYLQLRLSQHLLGKATVFVPASGAEAVLAGAVHYCYGTDLFTARLSRYTYGFNIALPFEEGTDPEEFRIDSDYLGVQCRNRFERIATINQAVPLDCEVRKRLFPIQRDQSQVRIGLYASTDPGPRYVTDSVAEGGLTVDVSSTVSAEWDERGVDFVFRFGEAEIEVTATELATEHSVTEVIAFQLADSAAAPATTPRAQPALEGSPGNRPARRPWWWRFIWWRR